MMWVPGPIRGEPGCYRTATARGEYALMLSSVGM
jgi:hypothetical protein